MENELKQIAKFQFNESASANELLWDDVIKLNPGEKIQIVDNLTIEFYSAPFPARLHDEDVTWTPCEGVPTKYLIENFAMSKYCILLRGRNRVAALGLANDMPNDPEGLYYQLSCGGNISSDKYQQTVSLNKMDWSPNQKLDWFKLANMDSNNPEYWILRKAYENLYNHNRYFRLDGPSNILPLGFGTILRAILINFAITKGGYKHIYNEAATIGLARDYYARFGYVLYDTDLCNTTDDEVTIAHKKSLEAPPKNIDKEKLALFRACLNEDQAKQNDPSSANSKFYEKYNIYYFECDLCNEIDLKLKSLRTPSGSYKMKLCNLPVDLFTYCEKKFSEAILLLKKYDDWAELNN